MERLPNIVRLLIAHIYFDFELSIKIVNFLNKTPIIYNLFGSFPSLATALVFTKALTIIYRYKMILQFLNIILQPPQTLLCNFHLYLCLFYSLSFLQVHCKYIACKNGNFSLSFISHAFLMYFWLSKGTGSQWLY